ncbi:MAG: hypothetical protein RBT72_03915 [Spirochaetia bacterium]|jgi:hypothetical protein|nr:hypothetical protein [Spirochaetales bacterium]MDX9783882.1 hypothetical protein [Spirochaetia bacterium]
MKKSFALIGLIALVSILPLAAQIIPEDPFFGGLHRQGSQLITINVGAGIPLFIVPDSPTPGDPNPLSIGASLNIGYQYFVRNKFSIGGALSGAYNSTIGGRNLFLAPLSFRTGYWFGKGSIEASLGGDIGLVIMRLSGNGVISPFLKAGGGAYFQITNAWSLGGQAFWWFIPEIHFGTESAYTRYGNFLELSLGAVYHF